MIKLYEFYADCGRMGEVSGLFVQEESKVKDIIGKNVYFGEILGKHSEIQGEMDKEDFTVKSEDPIFINSLVEIFGSTISGHNPFDYLHSEEEEEE